MRLLRHLLPIACLLLAGLQSSHALVIAGSDLLDAKVRQALQDGLESAGLECSLSLEGSLLGLKALEEGAAEACILASPADSTESTSLPTFPVAFEIVSFMVHSTNPVTELNYSQLVNLFGSAGTSDDWSNLTSAADWSGRKISLWASRSQSTITLEIFNAMVLKGSSLKQSVRYSQGTADQLIAIVVEDPTALVMAPAVDLKNPAVRMLAIKESAAQQAYTPSPDNVLFGDYPLRLPLNLVVSDSLDEATVGKLLRVIYSPEVTAALQAMNCMPVPESERRSILARY